MSVFKVHLNWPGEQGQLDLNPATATPTTVGGSGADGALGQQMQPSIQRTMYVTGANRTYRRLRDGDVFTDCNYWKQFSPENLPLSQAFIEVVTDDGSVYSSDPSENTFPIVQTVTVDPSDTFATSYIDIMGTYGSWSTYTQIKSLGTAGTQDITVRLNGSASAVFTLGAGDTQIFSAGDLSVTQLAFAGGTASVDVEVILSVMTVCAS